MLFPGKTHTHTHTALAVPFHKEQVKKPSRKHVPFLLVKVKISMNNTSHCSQNSPFLSFPPLFSLSTEFRKHPRACKIAHRQHHCTAIEPLHYNNLADFVPPHSAWEGLITLKHFV